MSDQPKRKMSLNVSSNPDKVGEFRRAFEADGGAKPRAKESVIDQFVRNSDASEAVRQLEARVVEKLQTVYDPELPVNLYDLGLIYKLDVTEDGTVNCDMTLTNPGCPVADTLPREVQKAIAAVEGVRSVKVNLVWTPKWDKSRMSEVALLELGLI